MSVTEGAKTPLPFHILTGLPCVPALSDMIQDISRKNIIVVVLIIPVQFVCHAIVSIDVIMSHISA